mgnify:FL=1
MSSCPDDVVTETTSVDAYNPLSVIVSIVPDNMISAMSSNNSVLAVCFLGIVIGICMSRLGEKVEPPTKVFVSIDAIIQMFVNFVLDKLGPVCIFCMITRSLAVYGTDYLRPAAVWIATTMILCTVLAFTLYPLLIFIFTRLNPFKFAKKIAKVALFGAATQSSAATLRLT